MMELGEGGSITISNQSGWMTNSGASAGGWDYFNWRDDEEKFETVVNRMYKNAYFPRPYTGASAVYFSMP